MLNDTHTGCRYGQKVLVWMWKEDEGTEKMVVKEWQILHFISQVLSQTVLKR